MKYDRDERDALTPEDARFVERIRSHYAPPPLSPAQRTAFDARLSERLEGRRWRSPLLTTATTLAFALLTVWTVLPWLTRPRDVALLPRPVATRSESEAAFEQALFYGDLTRVKTETRSKELPPDYAAIESAFFDDV
jgi:hypothetical protein